MTMQSIATNRYDNRQDARGMAVPYPQPGSPTLTNPDMILPDYDGPDLYHEQPHTGPSLWNSGHHIEDGFQFTQEFYANPDPLSTPIIYGNGTMLSDIGEVTEVESVVGPIPSRNASKRSNNSSGDEGPFRASLAAGKRFIQQRQQQQQQRQQQQQQRQHQYKDRERRMSTESTSTIGAHDGGAFIDFDDSASVGGDSIFQGDDEESLASEYVEGTAVSQHLRAYEQTSVKRLSDDGASISKRAEQILANAKMRLTHMEDNLTRARTLSYSSVSDGSTPSPTMGRAPTSLRRPGVTPSPPNLSKHANENGAAAGTSSGVLKASGYPQRSASALGSAGGYRRPLPTSRSMDGLGSASAQGAHGHFNYYHPDNTLDPLGSNGNAAGAGGRRNGSRTTTSASPTTGAFSELGLTRSASASQMRDLQDQLKGLKGKISSLKEQARADSMKRRSLQSLRMPSPFTNATWDQGVADPRSVYSSGDETPTAAEFANGNTYNGDDDYEHKQIEHVAEPIQEVEEEGEEEEGREGEREEEGVDEEGARVDIEYPQTPEPQESYEDFEEGETPKGRTLASPLEVGQREASDGRRSSSPAESVATEYTEAESSPGAGRDGYASEGEESLYHESFQQPISHEDREDAFDYEHFFLHSAMGTMTAQRLRSESVSSADSVETTRGPTLSHKRSSSADTTASVDTFATAAEGPASRSSTASAFRVYTAADLFEDTRRRHAQSFRDSSSASDGTASSQGVHQRSSTMTTPRPTSTSSSIKSMHRPSYSSFESIGTNRSFPLVNKAKLNGGILTPGGSPDQGLKRIRDSLLTDASSVYSQNSSNGRGGHSPALQVLSKDVQVTVERLVASLGKCVLALGEADGVHPGGHELYRRRIEAALRILEGEAELP
ncbi:hypothetical protein TARUN_10376 [Trichoderma arundinaceum]|uniref:Uncharacterized protein n=1 Tax=Trichoderma arundinaceum TaxID=490622 RepID=A0A395N7P1_TRIAR|nr:hypothetical protein TARUN_10376 [Trichoderma arundinaceum]